MLINSFELAVYDLNGHVRNQTPSFIYSEKDYKRWASERRTLGKKKKIDINVRKNKKPKS